MKQLGKQRVANLFVHLRKIAQYPLLVRNHFSEAKVQRMAATAYTRSTAVIAFISGLPSMLCQLLTV